ncbi:MAG: BACON domain-containing protein, partial [Synergistaceae bacterium]|nr:BACON domain-containing protein [Synergistaceae bacterium]
MEVDYFWEEGFCFGKGKWVGFPKGFSWNGGRRYPRWHKYDRVNLTMPGHSWVEQKTFDISANGDKSAGLGFSILSEGSWTVASDQNWITFTRSSGEATGDSQYPIRFQVAENNTGRPREATITFTAKVGDKITETSKLRVNQASK